MFPRNVCTTEENMRSHDENEQNMNLTALETSNLTVRYTFAKSWSLQWLGGLTSAEMCNISDQQCTYYLSLQWSNKYTPYGKTYPTKLVEPHGKFAPFLA